LECYNTEKHRDYVAAKSGYPYSAVPLEQYPVFCGNEVDYPSVALVAGYTQEQIQALALPANYV
jgi:hypothetical protein